MLPLPTVHLNHINELRLVVLIGAIFTNLWLVSYALLLGSGELFWRHSLDLPTAIWPHNDALEGDLGVLAAAGFGHRERAWEPFGRMGIGRMIERAGEAAKLPFPVHVHMLRHSTGYALAGKGMDTRRLQHFLGHASITNTVRYTAMSPEPFKDIWR